MKTNVARDPLALHYTLQQLCSWSHGVLLKAYVQSSPHTATLHWRWIRKELQVTFCTVLNNAFIMFTCLQTCLTIVLGQTDCLLTRGFITIQPHGWCTQSHYRKVLSLWSQTDTLRSIPSIQSTADTKLSQILLSLWEMRRSIPVSRLRVRTWWAWLSIKMGSR